MLLPTNKALASITRGLKSHYPLIYIQGWEETRITNLLAGIASSAFHEARPLYVWNLNQGFEHLDDARYKDPVAALMYIMNSAEPALYLMQDLPAVFEQSPNLIRAVRDLYYKLKNKGIYVFFSHPLLKLPEALKKEIFLVDMPLPMEDEILQVMQQFFAAHSALNKPEDDVLHHVAVAMKGLSLNEVGHLQSRIFTADNFNLKQMVAEVQEEKQQILRKESCLRFYPPQGSLKDIGGLENLKEWVEKRKDLFSEQAFKAGIPLPSGILFMGVSGCGKSVAAKAIASAWNLPLVRLDMSLVLSGNFGAPEYAFEQATRTAEEIAPVVLWIDELENSFGYDEQGGAGGNINIFSSFLTWMQEKPSSVFLAATANRIQQLPAELMRKGRFDQLFFLDLPNKEARQQIFAIHIRLNGGLASNFDVGYMAAATKGWSGAEIEQAVKAARVDAYQEDRNFNEQDILHNCVNMVPLSRTMEEQIEAIKDWSFNRAVPASL